MRLFSLIFTIRASEYEHEGCEPCHVYFSKHSLTPAGLEFHANVVMLGVKYLYTTECHSWSLEFHANAVFLDNAQVGPTGPRGAG